ncbi:MAG TPA: alkaline phosphatase PhoX [Chloroflexia bacterium]
MPRTPDSPRARAQPQGFLTPHQALVQPIAPGTTIKPLLSTGDVLPSGYQMAGRPDGLGAYDNGDGTFTLYMNHELARPENISDARVSKLRLDKRTSAVLDAKYVVDGSEGYKHFCSGTIVGLREGFDRPYYLTGEESTTGKYGGMSIVIDSRNERVTPLVYAGRLKWENLIAVPGWPGKSVFIGFDDIVPGGIYMYVGNTPEDMWTGRADMYVFVADGGVRNEYAVSKGRPLSGRFVKLDKQKASESRDSTIAESEKAGYFWFSRPEDGTYDLNDPTAFYFNVTGWPEYVDNGTGKPYNAKGRLYRVQLDKDDPTRVTELKVLLDGDAGDDIISPDNIAASPTHLMLQEDIIEHYEGVRPARVVAYEIATGKTTLVAEVTQRDFAGRAIPDDKLGLWESSGIINASDALGEDMWLLDVQPHGYNVPQFGGSDTAGQLLAMKVPGTASVQVDTPGTPASRPAVNRRQPRN